MRVIGIEGDENFTNKMMLRINKIEQVYLSNQNIILNKAEGYTSFLTYKTTPEEFKSLSKLSFICYNKPYNLHLGVENELTVIWCKL